MILKQMTGFITGILITILLPLHMITTILIILEPEQAGLEVQFELQHLPVEIATSPELELPSAEIKMTMRMRKTVKIKSSPD